MSLLRLEYSLADWCCRLLVRTSPPGTMYGDERPVNTSGLWGVWDRIHSALFSAWVGWHLVWYKRAEWNSNRGGGHKCES